MTLPGVADPGIDWWLDGALLAPLRRLFSAIVIVAGPWLVAISALGIVSVGITPVLGPAAVEDLRLSVVYAFCIAPIVAGPIGAMAGRAVREAVEGEGSGASPRDILAVAVVAAALVSEALAVLVCLALGIGGFSLAVAFTFLSGAAAALWVSFNVLSALDARRFLIASFSAGMAISVGCAIAVARTSPSIELMVWSFTAGLVACAALAIVRADRAGRAGGPSGEALGRNADAVTRALTALWGMTLRHRFLALAIAAGMAAVWVDKWVHWFGPAGMRSAAGFAHFGPYDGLMFLAHLSIIPTFAAMSMFHDRELGRAVEPFRRAVREGAARRDVERATSGLFNAVWTELFSILCVQLAITVALVLVAPFLADVLGMTFDQFLTFRVAIVAVFLYAFVYAISSTILLCSSERSYLAVQATLLVTNVGLSIGFAWFDTLTAFPFLLASLVTIMVAFPIAYYWMSRYDFCIFVMENESIYYPK